jgi:hypothetical protein
MTTNSNDVQETLKDHTKRIVILERNGDVLSNKVDTTNKILMGILMTIILFVVNSILTKI